MSDAMWDVVIYGCWAIFAICFIAIVAQAVRFWRQFQAFKREVGK